MADASEMENIKEEICAVGQNAVDNINRLIRLVERPGSFLSSPLSLTTESQSTQGQQPTQPQTRSSCSPYGNNANHGSSVMELHRRFPMLGGGRNVGINRSRRTTATRSRPYPTARVGRPPKTSVLEKDVLIVDLDTDKQPSKSEKAALESKGRLISGFDIDREWTSRQLKDQLATLLTGEIEGLLFEIVKVLNGNLLVPNFPPGKQIDQTSSKISLSQWLPIHKASRRSTGFEFQ